MTEAAGDARRSGGNCLQAKLQLVREALGLLLLAAATVKKPQRFTRRAYALDARGRSVRVDDPRAVRFCLAGAVLRAEQRRFGTAMPVQTSVNEGVDDLDRPVLPETAPLRLRLAMEAVAWSARRELEQLGLMIRDAAGEEDPESSLRLSSMLHLPLLLGLHPRGGYERAYHALAVSVQLLAVLATDEERLDKAIADELIGNGVVGGEGSA